MRYALKDRILADPERQEVRRTLDAKERHIYGSVRRHYCDRELKPISWGEFALLFESLEYKTIRRDIIDAQLLSTVWLGTDHGGGTFFETMWFPVDGEDMQWRYCTEDEAIEGHYAAMAQIKEGRK